MKGTVLAINTGSTSTKVGYYVDGQPVLDMGGVHGKIYGEINFSQGTWTIAYNGADKTVDNRNIMSYSGGSTLSGSLWE